MAGENPSLNTECGQVALHLVLALPCPVYAVANVQFMLYSVQMSLYSVQMSLYSVQISLYSVQITLYSVIQCDAKYTNCIVYICYLYCTVESVYCKG